MEEPPNTHNTTAENNNSSSSKHSKQTHSHHDSENGSKKHWFFRYVLHFDNFFGTVTVFVLLSIFPLIVTTPLLLPFKSAIEDFDITDIYFSKILPTIDLPKETDIVVVNIAVQTDEGLKKVGNFTLSKLINLINENDPTSIGIEDILKIDTNNNLYNIVLANSLKDTKKLILATKLSNYSKETGDFNKIERSDSLFLENSTQAFTNLLTDKDKRYTTIRDFFPTLQYNDRTINKSNKSEEQYSFALELAKTLNPNAVQRLIKRGNVKETISYIGNSEKYEVLEAVDILEGNVEPSVFKHKIVILAPFNFEGKARELSRVYYTPLNEITAGRTYPDMYEVFIQANIVSMLLTDNYFNEMPVSTAFIIAFIFCYCNFMIFKIIKDKKEELYEISALILFSASSMAMAYLTVYSFYEYRYEMNLTPTIVTSATSLLIFEVYYQTIKPLVIRLVHYIKNIFLKK